MRRVEHIWFVLYDTEALEYFRISVFRLPLILSLFLRLSACTVQCAAERRAPRFCSAAPPLILFNFSSGRERSRTVVPLPPLGVKPTGFRSKCVLQSSCIAQSRLSSLDSETTFCRRIRRSSFLVRCSLFAIRRVCRLPGQPASQLFHRQFVSIVESQHDKPQVLAIIRLYTRITRSLAYKRIIAYLE